MTSHPRPRVPARPAALLLGCCLTAQLTAQAAWELDPPMHSPAARTGAALAIDPAGDVLLFGGQGPSGPLADTWRWNGSDWTQIATPHSPPATAWHALAYDDSRQRVVLFGGSGNAGTWEFDGADWRVVATLHAPTTRTGHAMTYDSARQRVVLFGGLGATGCLADTWEYDGVDWVDRQLPLHPSARCETAMAFDPRNGRTVLFGGRNANDSLTYDTWLLDGNGWSQAWVYANGPAPRRGHAMAFHPLRTRVVMFGDTFGLGTTHEWDGQQWYPAAGTVPTSECTSGLGLAWHAASERIVAFGGTASNGVNSDSTRRFYSVNPARLHAFGTGCPGTLGVPTLSALPWNLPWLGDFFDQRIEHVPSNSFTLLVFGLHDDWFGSLPLPLALGPYGAPGCTAYLTPLCSMRLANSGPVDLRIFWPWNSAFVGLRYFEQGFLLNAGGANSLGLATTNALDGVLGYR